MTTPTPETPAIPDEAVTVIAALILDSMWQGRELDSINAVARDHYVTTARKVLAAALPVLNTAQDSEVVQDQRIEIARALGLADDIVFDLDYLLHEITGLREANELKRARLIELGPIIDDLTHGGVAAELVSLRAEVAELRRRDAEYAASLRGEQGE